MKPVRTLGFHVTDRCQLNCQHCLRDPALKGTDIEVELVDRILRQAREMFGSCEASFTGGEPTLHPHFNALADAAIAHGHTWRFVSNAERFPQVIAKIAERPERMESLTSVAFSLDGATQATHDAIRGPGSFKNVLAAVSVATVYGIDFHLRMTPNRKNVHELEAFALMAAELGATNVLFSAIQPTGTVHDKALRLSFEEMKGVGERIQRLGEILNLPVMGDDGFAVDDPGYKCGPFSSEELYFDPHGQMVLCCRLAGIPQRGGVSPNLGDMREVSLQDAHRDMVIESSRTYLERLDRHVSGQGDAWERYACTACFRRHGVPFWTEDGTAGPDANRARWRGAWALPESPPEK